jgi:prepilin-type N-terminal cleavage/methylation domain-containing protein
MNKRGFTLVELLVVIAIISVLTSVVLGSLSSARAKARDARRVEDLKQISNALNLFYAENLRFPGDAASYYVVSNNNYENSQGCSASYPDEALRPYLSDVCTMYGPNGIANGDLYYYTLLGPSLGFRLGARFETAKYQATPFLSGAGDPVAAAYQYP